MLREQHWVMIYLQTGQMYRKFLQPGTVKLRTWKWWRWWDRLAERILPGKNVARLGFLETMKYKIWLGVLEIALHRRNTELRLGLGIAWTFAQCRMLWRMLLLLPVFVAHRTGQTQDVFHIRYMHRLLEPNVFGAITMRTITISPSMLSVSNRPGSYGVMRNKDATIRAAIRACPSSFWTRPLNKHVCWSCQSYKNPLQKCTRCNMARYCNSSCQARDWLPHRHECGQLAQFRQTPEGQMISEIQRQMKRRHRMTLVEAIERIALDSTRLQGLSDGKQRQLNFIGLLADIQAYIQEDHRCE